MRRARITGRRSKFNAKPTVVDGIRFASKAEAKRYGELRLLEKAGKICNLVLQPKFALWAHTGAANEPPRHLGYYLADFGYETLRDSQWSEVIEDVKGVKTPLYRWKKKHVEAQYGIQITEVSR